MRSMVAVPMLRLLLLAGLGFAQVKDKWGFQMTARYEMYAQQLADFVRHDFKPQVVRDPSLMAAREA